jgi:hypothetical protein
MAAVDTIAELNASLTTFTSPDGEPEPCHIASP